MRYKDISQKIYFFILLSFILFISIYALGDKEKYVTPVKSQTTDSSVTENDKSNGLKIVLKTKGFDCLNLHVRCQQLNQLFHQIP